MIQRAKIGIAGAVIAVAAMTTDAVAQDQKRQVEPATPSFEVATIKPTSSALLGGGGPVPPGTRQVMQLDFTAHQLIALAYGLPDKLVFGGSDWVDKQYYVVTAKTPDALFGEMQKMPMEQRTKQTILMLQPLLADRFKLKFHFEPRTLPVFELVVKEGGLKIAKEDDDTNVPHLGAVMVKGVARFSVEHMSMEHFAQAMQATMVDRPVVDKTGVSGSFSFKLNVLPQGGIFDGVRPSSNSDDPAESIFTAIQDLGLKLQPAKDPVQVIVIDAIARPSAN